MKARNLLWEGKKYSLKRGDMVEIYKEEEKWKARFLKGSDFTVIKFDDGLAALFLGAVNPHLIADLVAASSGRKLVRTREKIDSVYYTVR